MIGEEAFRGCTLLGSVELCEGLVSIQDGAFSTCRLLQQINIPSTVNFIHRDAFNNIHGLFDSHGSGVIKFSSGMETFLSEVSLRDWLVADGICNLPARYTKLVRRSVPMRFETLILPSGKKNIRGMLSRIPSHSSRSYFFSFLDFDPIESKLVHYLELQECVTELLDNTVVS